ncbi:MAG: US12 family protein [Oligoflexus sp.]|nr:US12 family protein [Oligoflexus sp.]
MNTSVYPTIQAEESAKSRFIKKTYFHLAAAIATFALLETFFFSTGIAQSILDVMSHMNPAIILIALVLINLFASKKAHTSRAKAGQYIGLGAYILAEAIIFVPLIAMSLMRGGTDLLATAALATGIGVVGITLLALSYDTDWSVLDMGLRVAGLSAFALIVCSCLFGFTLGTLFTVVMLAFSAVAILRQTGATLHQYGEEQYIAASLGLFASIMLLFWYVLRFMNRR